MLDKEFWKGRRVLITGHTGFKGSWLCTWLHLLGAQITGFALEPPTEPSLYDSLGVGKFVRDIRGDVCDLMALRNAVQEAKPEVVFHLAAQPIVRVSYNLPVETYEVNVMGTVNILEAVRLEGGVRAVVQVTTDKVYENMEWHWGYRETDTLGGYDPYASSKACCELVLSGYRSSFFNPKDFDKHGTALASARAGNVIGGGDWATDRIVPDCIRAALEGKTIELRSSTAIRPWQHVLEPLAGYLLLAEKLFKNGPKWGEGWNFGPAERDCISVGTLVELFCSKWGKGIQFKNQSCQGPHEAKFLKLDTSKARMTLGWKPVWSVELAMEAVVEWFEAYIAGENILEITRKQIEGYMNLYNQSFGGVV